MHTWASHFASPFTQAGRAGLSGHLAAAAADVDVDVRLVDVDVGVDVAVDAVGWQRLSRAD